MPHLTLEYTADLPRGVVSRQLFARLHHIVVEVTGADIENCKSRSIEHGNFLVGESSDGAGFVHLEVRILEGRTRDVKTELGRRLLGALRDTCDSAGWDAQVTVEVRDISRDHYFK